VNELKRFVEEPIKLKVNKIPRKNKLVKHLVEGQLINYNLPLNDGFDVSTKIDLLLNKEKRG
jgi:hypothetical protein